MSKSFTFISDSEKIFEFPDVEINFQSLTQLFPKAESEKLKYRNLEETIHQLDFDFYQILLPKIAAWASDHRNQSKSVEPLIAGKTASVTYTSSQIRYILANAFFLNTESGFGTISLLNLYETFHETLAIERIRCLIEYFRLSAEQTEDNNQREISIERYYYGDQLPNWNEQNIEIKASKINIFTDRMENSLDADGFVDFANKRIHIHRLIASATQEEVLFSCCPEAFVSILLCEKLDDHEIVILRGCKRFIDYVGYGNTFRYKGPYRDQTHEQIQTILVMDACDFGQFTPALVDRDFGKAWAAFKYSRSQIIVSGHWGCGVFGGDFFLKLFQQTCASMILDENFKRLDYSVYGDQPLCDDMKNLLNSLEEKHLTVAEIYRMIIGYHENMKSKTSSNLSFRQYLDSWLKSL